LQNSEIQQIVVIIFNKLKQNWKSGFSVSGVGLIFIYTASQVKTSNALLYFALDQKCAN